MSVHDDELEAYAHLQNSYIDQTEAWEKRFADDRSDIRDFQASVYHTYDASGVVAQAIAHGFMSLCKVLPDCVEFYWALKRLDDEDRAHHRLYPNSKNKR